MTQENIQKNKRIKLLEYQAGIKEDISDKLNIIKDIEKDKDKKEETTPETSKALVPETKTKPETKSYTEEYYEKLRDKLNELDLFSKPIKKLVQKHYNFMLNQIHLNEQLTCG